MITLTSQHVEELRTPAGGFNQCAMEIVGQWPLSAGWKNRLVGTKVADRKWKAAVKAAKAGPKPTATR